MKQMLVLFVFLFSLVGCAAQAPYVIDSDDTDAITASVVLSSEANRRTKALIEQVLDIQESFGKVMIDQAIVQSINGVRGPRALANFPQIYNNPMDGSFEVHITPGIHTLVLAPNYHLTQPEDRAAIELAFEAGHTYFVGAVVAVMRKPLLFNLGGDYRWRPVVVDVTTMTVVLPSEE